MKIEIADDFDLKKIDESGQCFRVRNPDDGSYIFILRDNVLSIKKSGENEYEIDCDLRSWEELWIPYFDLKRSYRDIRRMIRDEDRYLKAASETGRGIRVLKQDPFEMLITFIISQRRNIPSIKRSVELICERFGKRSKDYPDIYLFPDPADMAGIDEESLSGLSLGYRDKYIVDAVNKVNRGELPLYDMYELKDEELFTRLKSVNGVGDKVANCICLFAYQRMAFVPVDVWIQRVINEIYAGEDPFPSYGENAGIMQQWLYYAIRQEER
ncbi:MAG: DNA-3-methyladenine glycosylase 2 family protein [Lachnospiraceae bacterium]|nr:DNA-3-methyladenine glycosylase 2 family protein [Lachnospiraceae bacterium]